MSIALIVSACSGSEPTEPVNKTPAVASITVNPTQLSLVPGQPQALEAIARDANGGIIVAPGISWTSQSNSVATVGADGRVTAMAVGNTTVTGRAGTAEVIVPVNVIEGGYATASGGSFSLLGGKVQVEFPANAVTFPTVFTSRIESAPPANGRVLAGTASVFPLAPPIRSNYRPAPALIPARRPVAHAHRKL